MPKAKGKRFQADDFLRKFLPMNAEEKDRIRQGIVSRCELVADCWLYPVKNSAGYGMKWIAGQMRTVSRFMLAYSTKESLNLKGLDACHDVKQCPYRNCCNPRHLYWGSHSENCKIREQMKREWKESLAFWEGKEKSSLHGVLHGSSLHGVSEASRISI